MRLAAAKSLSVLISVSLIGTSSTFPKDKPKAGVTESPNKAQEPSLAEND
jgi:hypothetical protein